MISIMPLFWQWYYTEAVRDVLQGWRNFIIFSLEYFSIPLLLKTIFAPWKRDITKKPRGLDFKKFFEYLVFNAISRGLGFLVRFFTIIVGILFLLLVIVIGALFFIIWLILPLMMIGLLVLGFILLF